MADEHMPSLIETTADAVEAASLRLCEELQKPDDLNMVLQLKERYLADKQAHDAQLKAAVAGHFKNVCNSVEILQRSLDSFGKVRENFAGINEMWLDCQSMLEEYPTIKRLYWTQRNFQDTLQLVDSLRELPSQLQRIRLLLDADFANIFQPQNLLFSHRFLSELENLRITTTERAGSRRDTIEDMLSPLDELYEQLARQLSTLARNLVKVSHNCPSAILHLVKIIEYEERMDVVMKDRRPPREWKKKFMRELDESISFSFQGLCNFDDQLEETLKGVELLLEDLPQVQSVVSGCFPPEYHLLSFFVEKYHREVTALVSSFLQQKLPPQQLGATTGTTAPAAAAGTNPAHGFSNSGNSVLSSNSNPAADEDEGTGTSTTGGGGAADVETPEEMSGRDIMLLFVWEEKYYKFMLDELHVVRESLDPPILRGAQRQMLQQTYLQLVRRKMKQWIANLLENETREFKRREHAPEVDKNGLYLFSTSVFLFQMFNQQIELAGQTLNEKLLEDVVSVCCSLISEFQQAYSKMVTYEIRHSVDFPDASPAGAMEYLIAAINMQFRSSEFTLQVMEYTREEMAKMKSAPPLGSLVATIDSLDRAVKTTLADLLRLTEEILMKDVSPLLRDCFGANWYAADLVGAMVATMEDYFSDFQTHMNAEAGNRLAVSMLRRILRGLFYQLSVPRSPSFREPLVVKERFDKDMAILREFFGRFVSEKTLTEAIRCLNLFRNIVTDDQQMVGVHILYLKKLCPEIPKMVFERWLWRRSDFNKDLVALTLREIESGFSSEQPSSTDDQATGTGSDDEATGGNDSGAYYLPESFWFTDVVEYVQSGSKAFFAL